MHRYLSRPWKQRVRTSKRDASEIIVHRIVRSSHERNSVDQKSFRVRANLNRAQHQASGFAISLSFVSRANVINGLRALRRFHVLRGRSVDGIVARIGPADESVTRERPYRWEDEKLVADNLRCRSAETELEVRITRTRPQSVLEIECRAVRLLRKAEQLKKSRCPRSRFVSNLFLIGAGSDDDFDDNALTPDFRSADSINAPYLTLERRIGRCCLRIPEKIRELLGLRPVLEIRCAAGCHVNRILAGDVDSIRDDQSLVVQRQRTHEGNP